MQLYLGYLLQANLVWRPPVDSRIAQTQQQQQQQQAPTLAEPSIIPSGAPCSAARLSLYTQSTPSTGTTAAPSYQQVWLLQWVFSSNSKLARLRLVFDCAGCDHMMLSDTIADGPCLHPAAGLVLQDYYKAVMAEMYVDGAGMRGGGAGYGRAGGSYGGGYGSGGGGYSNGARGMDPAAAAAAGAGNGYEAGPSNVLRLRGLPFSAQKEDIVRWFEDCQITPLLPDK